MKVFSKMNDEIYLSTINIAGTHDSTTAYVSLENFARCQDKTIAEQLGMGVRLLDIRLSRKGNEFYLVHALADCYSDEKKTKRMTFEEVLAECKNFLKANPEETLILSIKQDRGIMSEKFFLRFYSKYIKDDENSWYLENKVPTVGECRGRLVLMRRCWVKISRLGEERLGLDFSSWEDQVERKTTALPVVLNAETRSLVQDRYVLNPQTKWQRSKYYLDNAVVSPNDIAVHFISTSVKTKGNLVGTAEYINKKFMEYPLKKGTGWILCDFPSKELIEKIVMSNTEKSEKI